MPPVFGPLSPSPSRLKSCAGWSGRTVTPSVMAKTETSGPSRNSSMTTRPQAAAWASASVRSSVTTTPLPAARPSSLTTYGGAEGVERLDGLLGGRADVGAGGRDVGRGHHVLGEGLAALELRRLRGRPEAGDAAARTASATPATSGASGPTTTRSTPSSRASSATAAPSVASTGCSWPMRRCPGCRGRHGAR